MTGEVDARLAEQLHDIAVDVAQGAAEVVRRAADGDLAVATKSTDTDLVTQVDRDTERWLVAAILQRRPGDAVLGEEGGARDGHTAVRWLIDPIDGTVNFVLGIPFYAVSVAAEVGGRVVAGAVVNPASGELFHARLDGGAWHGDRPVRGPRDVELDRAVVGTGFGYASTLRARQAAVVTRMLPQLSDIRRLGASSLEWCYVADGRLDGYFEAGLNPWDYAAGALVAAEAGCVVGGLRGEPISGRLGVAAGPRAAPALFELLESLDADRVTV